MKRGLTALCSLLLLAAAAGPERAWVKDQLLINLRSGPGSEFQVLGVIRTGDAVEVLARGKGWIHVRADHLDGWIPSGYLQPDPPAFMALESREQETRQLRESVEKLTREAKQLRAENAEISARDVDQQAQIELLKRSQKSEVPAERWPEWVVGAGIVTVGIALGSLLRGSSTRRTPRIKI